MLVGLGSQEGVPCQKKIFQKYYFPGMLCRRFKLDNESLLLRCSFRLYLAWNVCHCQQGQFHPFLPNVVLWSLLVVSLEGLKEF